MRRTISPSSQPSLPLTDLANLRIIKDCMLFDTVTGHFWRINKSGVFIIRALQKQMPMSELIPAFQKEFNLSHHVASRDIELFLNDITAGGD
jgi:hypothetical protein